MPRVPPISERVQGTATEASTLLAMLTDCGVEEPEYILTMGAAYVNFNRVSADVPLVPGDVWRVHLAPRRFPVEKIDWRSRILKETADFISIDKPSGIPVHPTCDNLIENVKYQLRRELQVPLWVTHRLDINTSGVLVLAKTKAYANQLRELFEKRKMEKHYFSLVEKPIECGTYTHFMDTRGLAPYRCSDVQREGWKKCELQIQTCKKDPKTGYYYIFLFPKTGRHHQIRSQLSYLGCPIVGDELYGSQLELTKGSSLLVHSKLSTKVKGEEGYLFGEVSSFPGHMIHLGKKF